jgi:sec-independent protein translocase protein TatC
MSPLSLYSDDLFEPTRMSFGDHLEELRRRLWLALLGFGVALVAGFALGQPVLGWIAAPLEQELNVYRLRRSERIQQELQARSQVDASVDSPQKVRLWLREQEWRQALGAPPAEGNDVIPVFVELRLGELAQRLRQAELQTARPPALAAFNITEGIVVYCKVSIYCGIVLSSPWIFYQLWLFVAAGLYPHERRWVRLGLPASVGLFLGGVLFCEFVVIPRAVAYLLRFNEWLGLEPELRLGEWLSFALLMPLAFGLSFQTPLVMFVLQRLGLVSVAGYQRHRRLAFMLLAVIAAGLTATPDPINMFWLAIPLWGLYELGIVLCRLVPEAPPEEEEDLAEEDLVGAV